ncbi:tRNA pseudouridine(55) synthase TruB [Paraoerskovia marina]|uniref:tRNA pseudouridine(55) synthase TruB n=1 Tax=Paraoerskovia marina TaxID=545619 RepID=UPI0004925E10|nr:tRNA pseudouridine(55) synthase TruB [Paraoerskovia marina]
MNRTTTPRNPAAADGLVVVDKPAGWTSHDVVGRMRRLAGTRKVGHAGTLDPMATGVLVLGVGRATRLLTYIVGADKDYDATIRLGVSTVTDDAEGEVAAAVGARDVDRVAVEAGVQRLTGRISQVPSAVSAIKVDGRRAYSRVRDGEQVELAARDVTVSRFEVLDVRAVLADVPAGTCPAIDVQVRVTVSSGTYVRALARDLGEMLGTGGHLTSLRRTRVGGFGLDVARSLDELGAEVDENGVLSTRPMADAARAVFPVRELDDAEVRALSYGQSISPSPEPCTTAGLAPDGTLVALLENRRRRGVDGSRPVLVFAPA